jgi:hypothetical protein
MRIVRDVNKPQITPTAGLYSIIGWEEGSPANVGSCVGSISTGVSVVVAVGDMVGLGM